MFHEITMKDLIKQKLEILRDFQIITGSEDPDYKSIKRIFETAANEIQLDNLAHDLVTGKKTVKEFLKFHRERGTI